MCLNIYFCREQQLTGSLSQMAENISSATVPVSLPWWDDSYQAPLGWLLFQLRLLWGRGWKRDLLGRLSRAFPTAPTVVLSSTVSECSLSFSTIKKGRQWKHKSWFATGLFYRASLSSKPTIPCWPTSYCGAAVVGLHPAPSFPVPHCLCCLSKKPSSCFWLQPAHTAAGREQPV